MLWGDGEASKYLIREGEPQLSPDIADVWAWPYEEKKVEKKKLSSSGARARRVTGPAAVATDSRLAQSLYTYGVRFGKCVVVRYHLSFPRLVSGGVPLGTLRREAQLGQEHEDED